MTGIEPAAFRLGGEPSILLRYMDVYKIFSVGRLLQQALRSSLWNVVAGSPIFLTGTFNTAK